MAVREYLEPRERRFWLCRAEGGYFYQNFIEHEIIGIGHIQNIRKLDLSKDKRYVKSRILAFLNKKNNGKSSRSTITNHLNQVLHFIYDLKDGDIVFSMNKHTVAIGVVKGDAYFSNDPKSIVLGAGKNKQTVTFNFKT